MAIQLNLKPKDGAAPDTAKAPKALKAPKAARGRIPTKQNINLAMMGVKKTNWAGLIIALVLILAVALAGSKFLILDRLAEVEAAQNAAEDLRREISFHNARINSFGELNDVYAHYTYTGMTQEERVRVNRSEVMSLLQRTVILRTDVAKWDLKGNLLTVSVQGRTLEDINVTAQKLRDDPLVNYCQVNTAATVYTLEQNQDANPELVSATIIAYLNKPEEVAEK
jgi:hypothetical protein